MKKLSLLILSDTIMLIGIIVGWVIQNPFIPLASVVIGQLILIYLAFFSNCKSNKISK